MGVGNRSGIIAVGAALVTMLLPLASAQADGDGMRRVRHYRVHAIVLPPERHVVEAVRPPYSGNYQFNGRMFVAQSPRCAGWIPGERIRLLRGDWNGYCSEAVFYNVNRGAICRMSCGGFF